MKNFLNILRIFVLFFILAPFVVAAFNVERITVPMRGDFVLQPAKIEVSLLPDASAEREIFVTNRMGATGVFSLSVEDFAASDNPDEGAVLQKSSGFSNFISYSKEQFTLSHGERARIPVKVFVPNKTEPGEIFGALLVSGALSDRAGGAAKITSRVGALFFVKVTGDIVERGELLNFSVQSKSARILFKNTGTVHINPYGVIEIKNIFGKIKKTVLIDPWFVLPDSTRARNIKIGSGLQWGRYTATILLNRGYNNIIDSKSAVFWVLPPLRTLVWLVLAPLLVLFAIFMLFRYKRAL